MNSNISFNRKAKCNFKHDNTIKRQYEATVENVFDSFNSEAGFI